MRSVRVFDKIRAISTTTTLLMIALSPAACFIRITVSRIAGGENVIPAVNISTSDDALNGDHLSNIVSIYARFPLHIRLHCTFVYGSLRSLSDRYRDYTTSFFSALMKKKINYCFS